MTDSVIDRLGVAVQAARTTGAMLADLFHTGNQQGRLKADRTLVTEADQAADEMIREIICGSFPGDGILSEEGSTTLPDTEHVWIIDPLDGTVNFSRGLLYWGVSIAHLEGGFPRSAAVSFPLINQLFSASLGEGAWLNGQRLSTNPDFDASLFPLFLHCSRIHQRYQIELPYKKRSLGAAAYHLCQIANNNAVLAFESTVRIWDFAASWLIIQEAGGRIASFSESNPFPVEPGKDYHKLPFPIVAAVSDTVMEEAKQNITRK